MSTATLLNYSTYALALALGAFAIIWFAVKRKPVMRSMGITLNRWLPVDLGIGLAIPFVAISLAFIAELLLGAITVAPATLTLSEFMNGLGLLLFGAALEEFLFRVMLLSGVAILLSRLRYGRWIAVAATAILFGAIHLSNPGASAITAFGTGLGGVIYAVAFLATRSVWLPFALHVSWNLSQGLWGLPISGETLVAGWFTTSPSGNPLLSGGDYGPEAGIPGMLARVLIIALVLLSVKKRWPEGDFATLRFAPDPEKRIRQKRSGRRSVHPDAVR